MTFKNCILYLIGYPGVGKLSIAREICKQADFRLIDNHAINNLVFPFVRVDGKTPLPPETWIATLKIRNIALDFMAKSGNKDFNFVFTNALADGDAVDIGLHESLEKAVHARAGCLISVRILCDENEHKKRIASPDRELNMKATDVASVPLLHQSWEPLKPNHPNVITIDVTKLSAFESAQNILKQAEKIYDDWAIKSGGFISEVIV